jgi:hypothetical protein
MRPKYKIKLWYICAIYGPRYQIQEKRLFFFWVGISKGSLSYEKANRILAEINKSK